MRVFSVISRYSPFPPFWEPRLGHYTAVTWPRGAWRHAYLQRTEEEQTWVVRVLLRASRLGRVPKDWAF